MARFNPGDRVAFHEKPDKCGTVIAIVEETPAGAVLEVQWDHIPYAPGPMTDAALVPCDGPSP
jgi:hypothetical protein